MENPILYVILNKELNMSAGKASAQAVHAAMMLEGNYSWLFSSAYKRTVVVLEAENSDQIRSLWEYLKTAGIFSDYYIDEGFNEVGPYSVTALAVEPIAYDDEEKRSIFRPFSLFNANPYESALDGLTRISHSYRGGLVEDYTPGAVRRAIKWLRKNK